MEKQRRDMGKLLSAYRAKIAKLEEAVKQRSEMAVPAAHASQERSCVALPGL